MSLWRLDLQSELVYVGDEGVTEPNGRTRRIGIDLEARGQVVPWLWADADVNLARARFRDAPDGADRIPLAPSLTWTAGLMVRDIAAGVLQPLEGGLRIRHLGARAATEDDVVRARGYTMSEIFAGWRLSRARVYASVDNLFDVPWNEAQFATTSRLLGEADPVTELHYTPGQPRGTGGRGVSVLEGAVLQVSGIGASWSRPHSLPGEAGELRSGDPPAVSRSLDIAVLT